MLGSTSSALAGRPGAPGSNAIFSYKVWMLRWSACHSEIYFCAADSTHLCTQQMLSDGCMQIWHDSGAACTPGIT